MNVLAAERRVFPRFVAVLALAAGGVGCANLQTVNRTTDIPGTGAKAIHLDAQQRLVMFKDGKYCAEPSPDALAAYASSLGLGISGVGKGAASASNSLESAAGSIGLRTQSITLLRDALYRTCEASMNGSITQREVASLLVRGQNLSAVVLAIEQLTGTVAAQQVVLGGSASGTASADLLSNQQFLDEARKQEATKKAAFDDATAAVKAASEAADIADAAHQNAVASNALVNAPGSAATAEAKAAAAKAVTDAKATLDTAVATRDKATADLPAAKKSFDEAVANREAAEQYRESALTAATSGTTGTGTFSPAVQRTQLDSEGIKAVAAAVSGMVNSVMNKSYLAESCVDLVLMTPEQQQTYISSISRSKTTSVDDQLSWLGDAKTMCVKLLSQEIRQEVAEKQGQR